MGFRFRKSVKIAPGIKLNLGKKSASVSFGGKGARYTVSSTGRKTASVGIPGTGISYSENVGGSSSRKSSHSTPKAGNNGGKNGGCLFAALQWMLILMLWPFFLSYWFWKTDKVNLSKKARTAVICAAWILLVVFSAATGGAKDPGQIQPSAEPSAIASTATSEPTPTPSAKPTAAPTPEPTPVPTVQAVAEETAVMVWIPINGGTKYHSRSSCSNMENPIEVTLDYAISLGFTKCSRC